MPFGPSPIIPEFPEHTANKAGDEQTVKNSGITSPQVCEQRLFAHPVIKRVQEKNKTQPDWGSQILRQFWRDNKRKD
jgi:hypothetical protein